MIAAILSRIPSIWAWVAGLGFASAIVIGLLSYGDRHGFNAAKVAKIERELADVNSRIAAYTLRDDQAAIDADVLRNQGYQRALADLGSADKAIVTPAMAKAFSRIAP